MISSTLTSADEQLLSNISTLQRWPFSKEEVDDLKREILKEIRPTIPREILEKPFLYIGSYKDIEAPLFLGFSNIILVELGFAYTKILDEFREKILLYSSYTETVFDGYRQIEMFFNGQQRVFTLIPKIFQNKSLAKEYEIPLWSPPKELGMIFSFAIHEVDFYTKEIYESLVPNGYLCVTSPSRQVVYGKKNWNDLGYKQIVLDADWTYYNYFLQKTPK